MIPTIAILAEPTLQQWGLLCGVIVLATVVIMNMRRRRPLDGSPRQYRREIDGATQQSIGVKRDMADLLVELDKLARNINAQIDTKFAKLEQSIADADKRISAMRILIDEAKRLAEQAQPQAGPQPDSPASPTTDGGDDDAPASDQPGSTGVTPVSTSKPATSTDETRPPDSRQPETPQQGEVPNKKAPATDQGKAVHDARHQPIYDLADRGLMPVEIARETGQTIGEIELILNLRRTKPDTDPTTTEPT